MTTFAMLHCPECKEEMLFDIEESYPHRIFDGFTVGSTVKFDCESCFPHRSRHQKAQIEEIIEEAQ